MNPSKRILTISRDRLLQASRTLLLESVGYTVIALASDDAVAEFMKLAMHPTIDLVLMCHSVPERNRVLLCKVIKLIYPAAPILMLYNGYDPTAAVVDGRLENMHDPQSLVETLGLLRVAAQASDGRSQ